MSPFEVRRHVRCRSGANVRLWYPIGTTGTLLNCGSGGACLYLPTPLARGTYVAVEVSPGMPLVGGEVRWVVPDGDGCRVGIAFGMVDDGLARMLAEAENVAGVDSDPQVSTPSLFGAGCLPV